MTTKPEGWPGGGDMALVAFPKFLSICAETILCKSLLFAYSLRTKNPESIFSTRYKSLDITFSCRNFFLRTNLVEKPFSAGNISRDFFPPFADYYIHETA